MSKIRWDLIAIFLINISIFLVWSAAYVASDILGEFRWIFYGSGFLALTGLFCFKGKSDLSDASLTEHITMIEAREKRLREAENRFRKRENRLTRTLITHYEWMEFPKKTDSELQDDRAERDVEWYKQDQEVLDLLEKRTEQLFDKIRHNKYHENGIFQKNLLSADILDIFESVAKIYNPNSENPLLETSIEKLLRAINRISLQLLVLLEQLPINLKDYNLKTTYENIQTGVKAYSVYKTAEPYLPLVRPAYYIGRFVLGANPVTMGAGWAVGEIFTKGAKKISSHLANQYALNLLHEMVFMLGNEAAGIFGGDYRYRSSHWIYGAELTDLISRFPVSQEILFHVLNEIGALRLRSEYDRIFLYRCLAAQRSASPETFDARNHLSTEARQTIAGKLEQFLKHYIYENPKIISEWKADVEERLGVKIHKEVEDFLLGSDPKKEKPVKTKAAASLFSLASFLLDIKNLPIEDLPVFLSETRIIKALDKEEEILRQIQLEPPMIFDYPDLEPSDTLLEDYLNDLMFLTVRVFPHDSTGDAEIISAANYFRWKKLNSLKKSLDHIYVDFLTETLLEASPEKIVKPYVARALLTYLEPDESLLFLYKDIAIEPDGTESPYFYRSFLHNRELWMIGTMGQQEQRRLRLIAIASKKREPNQNPILLWCAGKGTEGEPVIQTERVESRFNDDCRIRGGTWYWEAVKELEKPPVLRLSGQTMIRYENYFRLIMEFCQALGS